MELKRLLAIYRRALLKVISIANLWVYLGFDQCCFLGSEGDVYLRSLYWWSWSLRSVFSRQRFLGIYRYWNCNGSLSLAHSLTVSSIMPLNNWQSKSTPLTKCVPRRNNSGLKDERIGNSWDKGWHSGGDGMILDVGVIVVEFWVGFSWKELMG